MTTTVRELFPDEISDEAAYHLVTIFYNLALEFESIHLGKILRHGKTIIESSGRPEDNELLDPPF